MTVALLTALLAAACGAQHSSPSKPRPVSLVLDFTPNAIHAGIYTALERGYDHAAGIDLHVIVPSASTDAIRLLETGRADFAILDIHDLAIARERGQSIAGILPIVQRPLAAVIAAPTFRDPAQLQGQTVGVSGDPSDLAVLDSVVRGSGGDPAKVKTITIGFDAVADLLAGRVAAATAFWNDEGVTLQRRQPGFHVFRVDDYGAPVLSGAGRLRLRRLPARPPGSGPGPGPDLDARLRRGDPEPAGRRARARITGARKPEALATDCIWRKKDVAYASGSFANRTGRVAYAFWAGMPRPCDSGKSVPGGTASAASSRTTPRTSLCTFRRWSCWWKASR